MEAGTWPLSKCGTCVLSMVGTFPWHYGSFFTLLLSFVSFTEFSNMNLSDSGDTDTLGPLPGQGGNWGSSDGEFPVAPYEYLHNSGSRGSHTHSSKSPSPGQSCKLLLTSVYKPWYTFHPLSSLFILTLSLPSPPPSLSLSSHLQKVVRPMVAMALLPVAVPHHPTITPPAITATTATQITVLQTVHSPRSPWTACGTRAASARRASSPASLSSSLCDTPPHTATKSPTELVSAVDVLVT